MIAVIKFTGSITTGENYFPKEPIKYTNTISNAKRQTLVDPSIFIRAVLDFGSGSGQNPALFPNPALAKIPPEPDSFDGFE